MQGENNNRAIKVLIAEDDPANQHLISIYMVKFGFICEIVPNGFLAIEKMRNNIYDVVLMDLRMPIIDGYEAVRTIRKEISKTVPIIAMTAYVMETVKQECFSIGMNDYIVKPIDAEKLKETILKWAVPKIN